MKCLLLTVPDQFGGGWIGRSRWQKDCIGGEKYSNKRDSVKKNNGLLDEKKDFDHETNYNWLEE